MIYYQPTPGTLWNEAISKKTKDIVKKTKNASEAIRLIANWISSNIFIDSNQSKRSNRILFKR